MEDAGYLAPMKTRGKRRVAPHKVRIVVGQNVSRIMGDKRITSRQLAEKTSMDRTTIDRLRRGAVGTTLDNVGLLADALDSKPLELFVERETLSGRETPQAGEPVMEVTDDRSKKRRDKK